MTVAALDHLLATRQLRRATATSPAPAAWTLANLAGRLVELSGQGAGAMLTVATQLVYQAQLARKPVAWILSQPSSFFPPDLERNGVDLQALVVIRVAQARQAFRAADHLLRSGAWGLLLLDLGALLQMPLPTQTRLLGLTQKHGCVLLCLTQKPPGAPSLGSLVTLHAQTQQQREAATLRPEATCNAFRSQKQRTREGAAQHHLPAQQPHEQPRAQRPDEQPRAQRPDEQPRAQRPDEQPRAQRPSPPLPSAPWRCQLQVVKDKRRGPGWTHHETCYGPAGLP